MTMQPQFDLSAFPAIAETVAPESVIGLAAAIDQAGKAVVKADGDVAIIGPSASDPDLAKRKKTEEAQALLASIVES